MPFAYLARRARSFAAAVAGLRILAGESHSRIHALATVLAVVAGAVAKLTPIEWCALVFAIALVWVAEGLNTAIEKLADAVMPHRHDLVGKAKDVAAAAVLIAALAALAVGAVLFVPRLLAL